MFKQLSPLLSTRSLILTIASVGEQRIRVTITPRSTSKDESKEIAQPFAVEGTAEELDNELSTAIVSYAAEHMSLARSVELMKTNMAAALKDVKAETDKKVAEARKGVKQTSTTKPEPVKAEPPKPTSPSLFDAPAEPETVPEVPLTATSPTTQRGMLDTANEEEILKEAFYGADDTRIAA